MRRLWQQMTDRLRRGDVEQPFELEIKLDRLLSSSEPVTRNWQEKQAIEESLRDALEELNGVQESGDLLDLQERVLTGRWSGNAAAVVQRYQIFQHNLLRVLPVYLWSLHQAGRLDMPMFQRAVTLLPLLLSALPYGGPYPRRLENDLDPNAIATLRNYTRKLVKSLLAQPLDDAGAELLVKAITGYMRNDEVEPEGVGFLLVAAREHAWHQLGMLKLGNSYNQPAIYRAILQMVHIARPRPEDDLQELVAKLRQFPVETLQALLPLAHPALRDVLLQALDWEKARSLVTLLGPGSASMYGQQQSVGNSPDPENGVVNVEQAQIALEAAGKKRAQQVLNLFRGAQIGLGNEITLLEAVPGWNRADILKRLERRSQIAVKAYGLLPLEDGRDDVLERYLWLQTFSSESRQFGAQRQNSERAAVQVALANLAQVAGFGDVKRLELRMAARAGTQQPAPGHSWNVEPYRVVLELDGEKPYLVVYRGERRLKSIPRAVRQHAEYESMKEAVRALRQQASRLRTVLEEAMISGATFSEADVEALLQLPIAGYFLSRLIVQTAGGQFGLFEPDSGMLRNLDGELIKPEAPLKVAHPYHLESAGVLRDWQRVVVRQRRVQPFKQTFRELYLLTPAEEETATYSNRFANHEVDSAQAYRLFQSRNWVLPQDEYSVPTRPFAQHQIRAEFEFDGVGHYFSEIEAITSRTIYFERYPLPPGVLRGAQAALVPLTDVPPVVFSEVIRDADLIVSVAQWTEQRAAARRQAAADTAWRHSEEAFRRRGELVTVLLEELAIDGVHVEGHFALVQGKLANYRVHLGSASIHIEPGSYLCIVPARWGTKHEKLFLPFADKGDDKISEVISKILLLVNDDRIKDETILRQIRLRTAQ